MAPTEILAEQHYITTRRFLKNQLWKVALLTSSVKGKKRKEILSQIANGNINLVIGTHSLFQEAVKFKNLGITVIDEQHKFGVSQRLKLKLKSDTIPDILVMTATPIPRSLAMTYYGDMDYSVISEMPPGRKKVITYKRTMNFLPQIYEFIRKKVKLGQQAYFVYPLIEESEKIDLKNATEMYKMLKGKIFPEFNVALIHGRLKPEEKEKIMNDYNGNKIDILVATTVIEVGIDVPDASVMVIEHAERFGLSQLHQLRGRIGRSNIQSHCILIYDKLTAEARQRINAMVKTNDGFQIAIVDLKIRGPGEMMGTKQSGIPDFVMADIIRDESTLMLAKQVVATIISEDRYLSSDKFKYLKLFLKEKWSGKTALSEIL
jgi:ATP-dependent DNA helicase RecG